MLRFMFLLIAVVLVCRGQGAFDAYRLAKIPASRDVKVHDMVVDSEGNIYAAGSTAAIDLPIRNAWQEEFGGHEIALSADGGATWKRVSHSPSVTPGTLAVSPTDPNLWLLTGGEGVFKSTDGGVQWRIVSSEAYAGPALFDPADAQRVYLSGGGYLLVSTDAGDTWRALSPVLYALRVDPNGSGTLLANIGNMSQSFSRDHGQSWTPLNLPVNQTLAFVPGRPGWIYRVGYSAAARKSQLFLSMDWGASWQTINQELEGGYDTIRVDSDQPSTLFLMGAINNQSVVLRSLDGGRSFEPARSVIGTPELLRSSCGGGGLFMTGYLLRVSKDGGATWSDTTLDSPLNSPLAISAGPGCTVYVLRDAGTDGFLMKLNPRGQLLWSTYLGGSSSDSVERVRLDAESNVFVAGTTSSRDFPVTFPSSAGANGSFVAKFDRDGSLQYSRKLSITSTNDNWVATASGSVLFVTQEFEELLGRGFGRLTKLDPNGFIISTLDFPDLTYGVTLTADDRLAILAPDRIWRTTADLSAIEPWYDLDTSLFALAAVGRGSFYFAGSGDAPTAANELGTGRTWLGKWNVSQANFQYVLHLGSADIYSRGIAGPDESILFHLQGPQVDLKLAHPQSQAGTCFQRWSIRPDQYWGQLAAIADGAGQISYLSYTNECIGGALAFGPNDDIVVAPVIGTSTSFGPVYSSEILRLPSKPRESVHIEGVGNSVSGTREGLVGGMLAEIVGAGLGPEEPVDLGLAPGTVWPFELAGTRVLINGKAAIVVSVSKERITWIVPEGLTSGSDGLAVVVVERDGVRSNALAALVLYASVQVAPSSVRNEDGSVNSESSPARAGSTVTMLVNGCKAGTVLYGYWSSNTGAFAATVVAAPGYGAGFSTISAKATSATDRLRFASRVPAPPTRVPFFPGGPGLEAWELSVPVSVFVK